MLMRFTCARSDFQLAKSLVLLFRAFAFRHIDVRGDHLHKFSIRGEQRAAGRLDMFDGSIGKHNSELECEISFLTQGLLSLSRSLSRDHLDVSAATRFPASGGPAADQVPRSGNFPLTNREARSH